MLGKNKNFGIKNWSFRVFYKGLRDEGFSQFGYFRETLFST
jgi:hypothetical protein